MPWRRDVDGLAAALLGMLADRETVASMGRAAHADARERFDLPGFAARFEAIYREVAAR